MKRLTYISRFSQPLSQPDLEEISRVSEVNNAREGLTGALLSTGSIFYQILEGLDADVDNCFERIAQDPRHTGIFVLEMEPDILRRQFPDWKMKTIQLDLLKDPLVEPMKKLLSTFESNHHILERYTSRFVQDSVAHGIDPTRLRPIRREAIVLFSDIVGSTILGERLEPDKLMAVLRSYYDIVIEAIESEGGEVLKLLGDGIMARFEPTKALEAKRACEKALKGLAQLRLRSRGADKLLAAGFGLAQGPVVEGNVGSGGKLDFTLIGDAVNLASRLQALTRSSGQGLVFSRELQEALPPEAKGKPLGSFKPRGKEKNIEVFGSTLPEASLGITEEEIRKELE